MTELKKLGYSSIPKEQKIVPQSGQSHEAIVNQPNDKRINRRGAENAEKGKNPVFSLRSLRLCGEGFIGISIGTK